MSSVHAQAGPAIEGLCYIQNIGRFKSVTGGKDTTFGPLTLVYSENGRGKTTLCAILRSLATGDSVPILERRRLSATNESRAVVNIAGSTVSFNGTSWTAAGPRIAIFDEHFVDANVHSGLNVDAGHRKGVHELVVGEQGVRLQRQVEDLTSRISSLQTELRQKEQAIPAAELGSLSVDEFCGLRPVERLEQEIEAATRSLSVLRDAQAIRSTSEFRPFSLPSLDWDDLVGLLGAMLPDLEATAVNAVTRHFAGLGAGVEHWASEGLRYLGGTEDCPFCGQSISGSTLITHYRAYFSEAYAVHRRRIQAARERVAAELSGDRLAALQRTLQEERETHDFWARYFEIPAFTLDLDELADAWVSVRDNLLAALDAKATAPLEPISLDKSGHDAVRRYREMTESVYRLSAALIEQNSTVRQTKEHAAEGSAQTARARLEHLQAIQRRFRPAVDAACKDYLATKSSKTAVEQEKARARTELDEHRGRVFGTCQAAINRFLDTFNADFTLEQLRPSDAAGVPSSTYGVGVNGRWVALNPPQTPTPSFRTALSSGDRNTLALAFFFTSLESLTLGDTIVAIDDPISSLDDARAFATAQEIRKLLGCCRQLVVLSHSRSLLCPLWDRSDKNNTATLEIRDDGPDRSTLVPWDIEAAAVSEFDRLHRLVREYAEDVRGNPQVVAPKLRPLLESSLRVAFVAHFEPGWSLATYCKHIKQALHDGSPVLSAEDIQELDDLREYANRFHHSTNQRQWQEARANVNERELRGYAKRVLGFVTLDGRLLARAALRSASESRGH
jgi:wobble nucleotide-excising tRNase